MDFGKSMDKLIEDKLKESNISNYDELINILEVSLLNQSSNDLKAKNNSN